MATIKDVAARAGVSIATVSCALNHTRPVHEKTKAKIMEAIRELNYVPNSSAKNLRQQKNKLIGVLLPNIKSQFHTEIFNGIADYLQSRGYLLDVAFSNGYADVERERIDAFISKDVCGMLMITCQPDNDDFFETKLNQRQIPAIFMERCPHNLATNYIGFSNYQTAYYLTSTLIKKGYRKIGMLCGPKRFSSESESVNGYCDALTEHNIAIDDSLIQYTDMTKEDGFNVYLNQFSANQPEALIATAREIAEGALSAVQFYGMKIPDDIVLVSYGEESWNNNYQFQNMYLTSRPAYYMGELAAKTLLKNIEDAQSFDLVSIELEDPIIKTKLTFPKRSTAGMSRKAEVPKKEAIKILSTDALVIHAIQLLTQKFTNDTGCPVEFDIVPQNQLLNRIMHSAENSEHSHDLFMFDTPWLTYLVQNMCLADLKELVEDYHFDTSRLFKDHLNNAMIDQRLYGIPIDGGTQLLYYRRDLFEDSDIKKTFAQQNSISLRPPRTWKEFNNVVKFFTRAFNPDSPIEFGTTLPGATSEVLAPELLIRLWSLGGKLWDTYNRPSFQTNAHHAAFSNLLETLEYLPRSPFETSLEQSIDDFCSGKTAMLITYSSWAKKIQEVLRDSAHNMVGIHRIPGNISVNMGWHMGMNPFSTKREEAFQFLSWLCDRNTVYYLAILCGASPFIEPAYSHELRRLYPWIDYEKYGNLQVNQRNILYGKRKLIIPSNKIEDVFCDAFFQIVENGLSVGEALGRAQEKANKIFRSYDYPVPRRE